MKLGQYNVNERRCPVCDEECETILFNIDAWDCGFLKANKDAIDEEDVELVSEEVLWKENADIDDFMCPHCKARLTGDLLEAKRFLAMGVL